MHGVVFLPAAQAEASEAQDRYDDSNHAARLLTAPFTRLLSSASRNDFGTASVLRVRIFNTDQAASRTRTLLPSTAAALLMVESVTDGSFASNKRLITARLVCIWRAISA